MKNEMETMQFKKGDPVVLNTPTGEIEGSVVVFKEYKYKVDIYFTYGGTKYFQPFSKKTGKPFSQYQRIPQGITLKIK